MRGHQKVVLHLAPISKNRAGMERHIYERNPKKKSCAPKAAAISTVTQGKNFRPRACESRLEFSCQFQIPLEAVSETTCQLRISVHKHLPVLCRRKLNKSEMLLRQQHWHAWMASVKVQDSFVEIDPSQASHTDHWLLRPHGLAGDEIWIFGVAITIAGVDLAELAPLSEVELVVKSISNLSLIIPDARFSVS